MLNRSYNLFIAVLFSTLFFILAACSGGSGTPTSANGQGTVTAKLVWNSNKEATKSVAVAPAGVVTVRLGISGPTSLPMQADFPASDGKGTIYGVPAGTGLTVTASGLDASGVITHQGTVANVTIQAGQTTDVGTITMLAVASTLTSIAVTPPTPSIFVGATQQFTATGMYSDKTTKDLTSTVIWGSSTASTATITTAGTATAVAAGTSTITATSGTIAGSTTLTVTSSVITGAIQLPKTGQTLCYDAVGAVIACAGTGQDGALQKGVAWPVPRFIDNADGTVTDNLTGLIWTKNAACIVQQWYGSWLQANSVKDGLCGLTDGSTATQWRLPNRKEMQSLMELPPGHPFTNVQGSGYWTSTTVSGSPSFAWIVDLSSGWVYSFGKTNGVNYVWPVKAGL